MVKFVGGDFGWVKGLKLKKKRELRYSTPKVVESRLNFLIGRFRGWF